MKRGAPSREINRQQGLDSAFYPHINRAPADFRHFSERPQTFFPLVWRGNHHPAGGSRCHGSRCINYPPFDAFGWNKMMRCTIIVSKFAKEVF
ncbi:hypothetical protein [Pararhizobium sp. DWP3-4]|uniref:hypothetical protein n=1 Tax=Pararhizobium sp. DWP3-4 TaxID=2804565 RepID=UPI003CEDD49B